MTLNPAARTANALEELNKLIKTFGSVLVLILYDQYELKSMDDAGISANGVQFFERGCPKAKKIIEILEDLKKTLEL